MTEWFMVLAWKASAVAKLPQVRILSLPPILQNIMASKTKKIGDLQKILNKNPQWVSLTEYNHIRIQFPDGKEKSLLLTDKEIQRALDRAEKSPEDLPKVSWIRNIVD